MNSDNFYDVYLMLNIEVDIPLPVNQHGTFKTLHN